MNVEEPLAAETIPYDPPVAKATLEDAQSIEASSATPPILNALADDLAVLEASLSEDENVLASLRTRAIEGHISRLAYRNLNEEESIEPCNSHEENLLMVGTSC